MLALSPQRFHWNPAIFNLSNITGAHKSRTTSPAGSTVRVCCSFAFAAPISPSQTNDSAQTHCTLVSDAAVVIYASLSPSLASSFEAKSPIYPTTMCIRLGVSGPRSVVTAISP